MFVSGGGASNPAIMRYCLLLALLGYQRVCVCTYMYRCLQDRFRGFHVASTAEIGIDPDAKEVSIIHLECSLIPTICILLQEEKLK